MPFRYLRDPLFLTCLVLYFINRWLIKPWTGSGFFHSHFNDLICIPFFVPIMLDFMRRLGLRPSSGPPTIHEIMIPLLIWAATFEVILPNYNFGSRPAVADPLDVIYYLLGAVLSSVFWTIWYRSPVTKSTR